MDKKEAYNRGFDCGKNGSNTHNSHFSIFSSPENTKEWERGKADAALPLSHPDSLEEQAKAVYTTRHMCMNIEGALRNHKKKSMAGLITEDNGAEWTDKMVRNYLAECLAKGWRVIPMGDCEGFDYQTGCPGHPSTKEKYESKI